MTDDDPIVLTPEHVGQIIAGLNCPRCDGEQLRFEMRLRPGPFWDTDVPVMACQVPGCGFEEWGQPV